MAERVRVATSPPNSSSIPAAHYPQREFSSDGGLQLDQLPEMASAPALDGDVVADGLHVAREPGRCLRRGRRACIRTDERQRECLSRRVRDGDRELGNRIDGASM